MRTKKEIEEKIRELGTRNSYLSDFLFDCYKGSDSKVKIEKEMAALSREITSLEWVLNLDLPF